MISSIGTIGVELETGQDLIAIKPARLNLSSGAEFPKVDLGSVLDPSKVAASKYAGDEKAQLAFAAKHLESMFVQQMFKSMRLVGQAMSSEDNPLGQKMDDQFQAVLDEQMSMEIVSSSSFGIAEAIYKQMM